MVSQLYESALDYHRYPTPGKLAITATKPLATQRDLALAYSPGVAAACEEITKDETQAINLTSRGNLVGVITNGTAVLGLGSIGPLAAKPVMEGKAVLFKKFANIDVFDIEINEENPEKLVDIIASLEPTFGAINLEDIKAPECFYVEERLKERLKIPVFHDDQHGTAIITAAAMLNGLKLVGKEIQQVKLVCSGAGAAAIACVDLLVALGLQKENIIMVDLNGVIYEGREGTLDKYKARYCIKTTHRTLNDAIDGADLFLGVSAANVLTAEMVKKMADRPIILALANPNPEIDPIVAKQARPDAIVATGRSDHPNQVNNVLCFPYIFRGALDVGATCINKEMMMACVQAICNLAQAEPSDVVASAYNGKELQFGPEYIIPKPFDPRLIIEIPQAVAKAAMDTGVATRPITDFVAYRQKLSEFVFRSVLVMKPIFIRAMENPKRVVYAEGEDEKVLRAVQVVVDEKLAHPILIGRQDVVLNRIAKLGLRLKLDEDFVLVDPQDDPRYKAYTLTYHKQMRRNGVSPEYARTIVRTNTTVIAALMVHRQEADAMIAGPIGQFPVHLENVKPIIGLCKKAQAAASMSVLITDKGTFFLSDAYVNANPTAEEIAENTLLAAEKMRDFGIEPKIALLSHSNFGTVDSDSSVKMKKALQYIREMAPDLEIDGEMQADAAIDPAIREKIFPNSTLQGMANLLIMPNIDAANIALNLVKSTMGGHSIGPIILGLDKPAHVLTPSATVRRIVNMTALSVVEAQKRKKELNRGAASTAA
ncbi:MAG: NADP-dependent malic enzyme [Alphaproteobacteria bacterium]|nr:NADP-dependent malic enzyme [Alphaproteobacteria bacterium]